MLFLYIIIKKNQIKLFYFIYNSSCLIYSYFVSEQLWEDEDSEIFSIFWAIFYDFYFEFTLLLKDDSDFSTFSFRPLTAIFYGFYFKSTLLLEDDSEIYFSSPSLDFWMLSQDTSLIFDFSSSLSSASSDKTGIDDPDGIFYISFSGS